ncbi:hypothetical protein GCM10023165_17420 [Variovorax defluvii]|uniref:Uncharacterized protein n=1 Tax=Variovorax defluvii TaxID=913761 RepID=A0ABP8HG01_9BURK
MPARLLDAIQDAEGYERVELVVAFEGQDGDVHGALAMSCLRMVGQVALRLVAERSGWFRRCRARYPLQGRDIAWASRKMGKLVLQDVVGTAFAEAIGLGLAVRFLSSFARIV